MGRQKIPFPPAAASPALRFPVPGPENRKTHSKEPDGPPVRPMYFPRYLSAGTNTESNPRSSISNAYTG